MPKKYVPLLILILLVLFMWVEEVFIGEGEWGAFFQLPEHKNLRFLVKGMGAVLIFGTGYYGLSTLPVKWIKDVWLYWYGLAFLAVGLRIVLDVFLLPILILMC